MFSGLYSREVNARKMLIDLRRYDIHKVYTRMVRLNHLNREFQVSWFVCNRGATFVDRRAPIEEARPIPYTGP